MCASIDTLPDRIEARQVLLLAAMLVHEKIDTPWGACLNQSGRLTQNGRDLVRTAFEHLDPLDGSAFWWEDDTDAAMIGLLLASEIVME